MDLTHRQRIYAALAATAAGGIANKHLAASEIVVLLEEDDVDMQALSAHLDVIRAALSPTSMVLYEQVRAIEIDLGLPLTPMPAAQTVVKAETTVTRGSPFPRRPARQPSVKAVGVLAEKKLGYVVAPADVAPIDDDFLSPLDLDTDLGYVVAPLDDEAPETTVAIQPAVVRPPPRVVAPSYSDTPPPRPPSSAQPKVQRPKPAFLTAGPDPVPVWPQAPQPYPPAVIVRGGPVVIRRDADGNPLLTADDIPF